MADPAQAQGLICQNHPRCNAEIGCGWHDDLVAIAAAAGWTSEPSIAGKEPGTRHNGSMVYTLYFCPSCSEDA